MVYVTKQQVCNLYDTTLVPSSPPLLFVLKFHILEIAFLDCNPSCFSTISPLLTPGLTRTSLAEMGLPIGRDLQWIVFQLILSPSPPTLPHTISLDVEAILCFGLNALPSGLNKHLPSLIYLLFWLFFFFLAIQDESSDRELNKAGQPYSFSNMAPTTSLVHFYNRFTSTTWDQD